MKCALNRTPDSWRSINDVLHQTVGVQCEFPAEGKALSLLDGLASAADLSASPTAVEQAHALAKETAGLHRQLAVFEDMGRCPILAITGMLNSGKSSLLATYLSPANRARVLRGIDNAAATHRFVLWLPSIWRDDPKLLGTLIGFMTDLFEHPPEQLADDPQLAKLQYNGQMLDDALLVPAAADEAGAARRSGSVDTLDVPLIAYDTGLDQLKLGLIDCPDIQTGFYQVRSEVTGEALASVRLQRLARIGRLCSAFVVVSKLSHLHDETLLSILTTLRDAMPGVPRLLAVNKVKARYAPQTVYEEARGLLERFGMQAVFVAYDFRSHLAASRVPAEPPGMQEETDKSPLPIFFQADRAASQPRYLFHLGEQLDCGTLTRESQRSLVLQLKTKVLEIIDWYESYQLDNRQQLRDAWQAVADACYEFMAERDGSGQAVGLRLQASPAIIAQMADSLQRTAPAWMRLSLGIDRTARQLHQAVANSASRFKILQHASASVTQFTKRFRRGEGAQVVTPQRLADTIRSCDLHEALQATPTEQLVSGCERAMERFAAEDQTRLDEQHLDEWSRQVWQGMSWRDKLWKGTQPLAVVMAPLLAAVLVPFDGGGSAVLVFASAKELLAAAGLAAVMTPMATGGEALSIVHRETPWRQLSDLFASACDSLGLPRPQPAELPTAKCNGQQRRLLQSHLESKRSWQSPALQVWTVAPQRLTDLKLQSLKLAAESGPAASHPTTG